MLKKHAFKYTKGAQNRSANRNVLVRMWDMWERLVGKSLNTLFTGLAQFNIKRRGIDATSQSRTFRKKRRFLLFSSLVLIILTAIFVLDFQFPRNAHAWYNDSWLYRQKITFGNSGAEITSARKVKYDIDTSTLISAGSLQSDCDDIRFTDVNGKLLKYYIDTSGGACNTASTDIYVLVSSVASGTNVTYMYYGNPSAPSGSESAQFSESTFTPTSGPTIGSEEIAESPIAYWSFDEGYGSTTQDRTQNDNDGTITGATWQPEDKCISGKCLYFDESGDVVDIPYSDIGTDALTYSMWIKPVEAEQDDLFNFMKTKIQINTSTGRISYWANTDSGVKNFDSTGLTSQKWQHLAIVQSSTSCYVYINAKLVGSSTCNAISNTNSANTISSSSGANQYKGFIDDVKIYPFARSAAQLKLDYNAGLHGSSSASGSSVVLGSSSQNTLSDGLVGYWPMDETSGNRSDSSGNSLTLTDTNTVTSASGKFGNSADFEADNSESLDLASFSSLSDASAFTWSGWLNTESVSSAGALTPISIGTTSELLVYITRSSSNIFLRAFRGSGSTYITGSYGFTSDGNWVHATIVYDGTLSNDQRLKIYKNGELDTGATITGTVPTTFSSGAKALSLGKITYDSSNKYDGLMDEVRLYNRALSPGEIRQLYNWAPGPVAYWNMEEPSGSRYDSSTNNNSLTDNNTVSSSIGKFGKAAHFNRTNSERLSIADNTDVSFDNKPLTVNFWAKFDSSGLGNYQGLFGKWSNFNSNPTAEYSIFTGTSNDLTFLVHNGTTQCSAGGFVVSADTWYFISAWYDTSTNYIHLEVNGTNQYSASCTTGSQDLTTDFIIGAASTTGTNSYFSGSIDEFKIYNYVRNERQRIEDMNGSHPIGGSPIASQAGYWSLDEQQGQTAHDRGYSGNDGTLGATSSTSTDDPTWNSQDVCKVNGCAYFDGGDYITNPNFAATMQSQSEFTISFWAKNSAFVSDQAAISLNDGGAVAETFIIYPYDDYQGNGVRVYYNAANIINQNNATYSANEFNHFAFVSRSATDQEMYVNGKSVGTSSTSKTLDPELDQFNIGTWKSGTQYFAGYIDEVKVYTTALTPEEIAIDMNAGSALNFASSANSEASDLTDGAGSPPVGQWLFDEGVDNTCTGGANDICDLSGNGNDGAKTASSWSIGKSGKGLKTSIDGVKDFVSVTDPSSGVLDFDETEDYTQSIWIKFSATEAASSYFFTKKANGSLSTPGYAMSINATDRLDCYYAYGDATNVEDAAFPASGVTDGTWHYVSCIMDRDGSEVGTAGLHMYIDGELVASDTSLAAATSVDNTNDLTIGDLDTSHEITSVYDSAVIYNYARTPAQLAYDYNRGRPIAHYKLDECAGNTVHSTNEPYDSSLDGTITIGATGTNTSAGSCDSGTGSEAWNNGTTGKYGSSIDFDGTDDYVSVAGYQIPTTGSVSVWWQPKESVASGNHPILTSRNASPTQLFDIYMSAGALYAGWYNAGNDDRAVLSGQTFTVGQWYHISLTWTNGGTTRLYVNGVERATSNSLNATWDTSTEDLHFAYDAIGATAYGYNQLDDVQIYNYTLSAAQIKKIMNESSGVRFGD